MFGVSESRLPSTRGTLQRDLYIPTMEVAMNFLGPISALARAGLGSEGLLSEHSSDADLPEDYDLQVDAFGYHAEFA